MPRPFEKDIPWYPGEPPRQLPTADTTLFAEPLHAAYAEYLFLRNTALQLPPRSRVRLFRGLPELVNQCFKQAYPKFYREFSILSEQDVRLAPDEAVNGFIIQKGLKEMHPFRMKLMYDLLLSEPGLEFGQLGLGILPHPKVATFLDMPGRPVFYPESFILQHREGDTTPIERFVSEGVEVADVGRVLIHENVHRSTKTSGQPNEATPISPTDPIFRLAFATEEFRLSLLPAGKLHDLLTRYKDRVIEFTANHAPVATTDGARIMLYCEDDDGSLRLIAQGGFEINEIITDLIASGPVDSLLDFIERRYDREIRNFAQKLVTESIAEYSNLFIQKGLLAKIAPYLEKLGLSTPETIIEAYLQGQIPYLHTRFSTDLSYT